MSKLIAIDETNRRDHYYLSENDHCYFFLEYTPNKGYRFSNTNQLITNLKKKPSGKHKPDYRYKAKAIGECSALLRGALDSRWLAEAVMVPVPGSKASDHPDFDTRMELICQGVRPGVAGAVRSLVRQTASTEAFHHGSRANPHELAGRYEVVESLCRPEPRRIVIVDDVLTTGSHYCAMRDVLSVRFPEAAIVGVFIARVVRPSPFEAFEDLDAFA